MNVKEIVLQWLKEKNHDGLCNIELNCGCSIHHEFAHCNDGPHKDCVIAMDIGRPNGYDEFFVPKVLHPYHCLICGKQLFEYPFAVALGCTCGRRYLPYEDSNENSSISLIWKEGKEI